MEERTNLGQTISRWAQNGRNYRPITLRELNSRAGTAATPFLSAVSPA